MKKLRMMISITPTAHAIVELTDQIVSCSLASDTPSVLLTTQKYESLKYPKKSDPTQHATAPSIGLELAAIRIGAEILAAVVMATVPEPWMNLIAVEMISGRMMIGIAV